MSRFEVSFRIKLWVVVCTAAVLFLLPINTTNAEIRENVVVTMEDGSSDEVHLLNSAESAYRSRRMCDTNENSEENKSEANKLNWIHNILPQRLANFRPRSKVNQLCNVQSDMYEESLRNLTLWALQMKEASATTTPGMLVGHRTHFGHFDECVGINNPSVPGRYCLVSFDFHTNNNYSKPLTDKETLSPESNVRHNCQKSKHSKKLDKNLIKLGVCVPAACSRLDVEESLTEAFADVERDHGISLNISAQDEFCFSNVDNAQSPTFSSRAVLYAFALLSTLTVFSTLHHLISNDKNLHTEGSIGWKILRGFSMVNSFRSLTRLSEKEPMNILDGLKFYTMLSIVIYHRFVSVVLAKLSDPNLAPEDTAKLLTVHLMSNHVDTNFTISGFLLFMSWYPRLKENGIKIIPSIVVNRWLRLTPAYLAVIIFTAALLPHIGSGPMWKAATFMEAENCQRNWWTHLLGINNINMMPLSQHCLLQTWYLACDYQLLLVGIFLVYSLSKNHSLGLKVWFVALALSVVIPFSIVYMNSYNGFFSIKRLSLSNDEKNRYFEEVYFKSWCRAGPYLIGIIAGFLLLKIKEGKWNFPKFARWLILFVVSAVVVWSQYYSLRFFVPTREYNILENAIFASLHRHFWGIMISTIIVIQLGWGFGKHIEQLLTHSIYVPLSRLSYMVFLIHVHWQRITVGSVRAVNFTIWSLVEILASDILICYLVGLWLYLIIEGPFERIRSILMGRFAAKKQHQT